MWTPEITRARFVEAAHTERFLPAALSPHGRGYWPAFFHDDVDKAGWDDAARLDNAEKSKGRAPSGAISRHQECMVWTSERIGDMSRRQIVWAWSFCRANGWDFGARCSKRGWARPTAYRRLSAAIEGITHGLNNEGVLLRLPHERWLRQEEPNKACVSCTMDIRDSAQPIKIKPGYRTEKVRDLIRTEEDAGEFAKFLERRNAIVRREQERRRKLGLEGAA